MAKNSPNALVTEIIIWAETYKFYAQSAQQGKLFALLLLMEHIQAGYHFHQEVYKQGRANKEDFNLLLEDLKISYDPTNDITRLGQGLICVEICPESYLYPKLGKKICGKFLGMSSEPMVIKLLNEHTGQYEDEEVNIILEIAYPTSKDVLRLSILDIEEVESFL